MITITAILTLISAIAISLLIGVILNHDDQNAMKYWLIMVPWA
jgi:hypothetical protein